MKIKLNQKIRIAPESFSPDLFPEKRNNNTKLEGTVVAICSKFFVVEFEANGSKFRESFVY